MEGIDMKKIAIIVAFLFIECGYAHAIETSSTNNQNPVLAQQQADDSENDLNNTPPDNQNQTQIESESDQQPDQPKPARKRRQVVHQNQDLDNLWNFSLGISYDLGTAAKFDSATISGTSGYSYELEYDNSFSIEADARYLPQNSWGFITGLTYDFDRKLNTATLTGNGVSSSEDGQGRKLRTTVAYASAVYRWEKFYLPFGLNYSDVTITPSTNLSISGSVGVQLGIGYYVKDNFAIEAISRTLTARLKAPTSDFGTGHLTSIMLTAKYIF